MQNLNIYIVEDNALLAMALKHNLLSCGHHVCGTATTFEQAVNDLRTLRPDLIITDIMLATAKTGIDLAGYINRNLQIPFMFQSSITDPQLIQQAMLQEPVCYLTKPANRNKLAKAISQFCCPQCLAAGK